MSSTNTLSAVIDITSVETLSDADFPAASQTTDRTLRTGGFAFSGELTSTTVPALGNQPVQLDLVIGAGITTIDLTAAGIGIGRTATMTGLKLIAWHFAASSSNTGAIKIAPGAADGYSIWGGADGIYYVQPGETAGSVVYGKAAARGTVGASAKNVAVSGTQNDTIEIMLWFGT